MPLVLDSSEDLPEGQRAALPPQTDPTPGPSALDVAAAAERQTNIAGMAYDRFYDHPRPDAPVVPGFDPLASVPQGYEQYADRFLDAQSPQEMQWIKGRIHSEMEDRQTIARAGGWGVAASLASGATDPLTIASMAIPGGGTTRLASAARLAAISAGTTAAQELVAQNLSETRTPEESLTNIGASTVLGGLLGAVIRPRVPAAELERLRTRLSADTTEPAAVTEVLGPERGRVLDRPLPSDTPAAAEGPVAPPEPGEYVASDAEEAVPGYTVEEGDTHADESGSAEPGSGRGAGQQELGRTAAGGPPAEGWAEETRIRGARTSDPLTVYRGGDREVGPEHFDEGLGSKTEHPSSGLGVFFTTSESEAARWGEVRPAQLDIRNPKVIRNEDLPGFDSLQDARDYSAQLQSEGYDGIVLKNKHLGGHDWVIAFEPDQVIHEAPHAPPAELPTNPNSESTSGAAAVAAPGIQGNTIAAGGRTIAEGWIGRVAPGLRLLTSPSNEARELVQQLAETRELLNKNLQGVATPTAVETVLRGYEGDWWRAWKARGQAFRTYRERIANTNEAPLSRHQFGREIAYAMRRGDEHVIPEVADAAAKTRAIVFDPLKERAMKLGLLPEEVQAEGADSYLTRQYDAQRIRDNMGQWMDTLVNGFRQQGVDTAEARDIAHSVTRNVLGSERGTMDWRVLDDVVPESGRLKERTLKLPDAQLEPFLNSDIDHLSHSYLRSMAPEVEMTERFGSRDLTDQLDAVKDEYARLIEQAKSRGDNAAMLELDKRRDADIEDLAAIRDRLYGNYGQPKDPGSFFVRAGRLLRSGNALRLLGTATLAHVPDLANVITRFGLPNTFTAIGKLATSWNAIQIAREEARRLGVGLDMVMNSTAALLGDYGSHSQFLEQRVMAKLTRGFTILTGETPLITTLQSLASVIGQDELLRNAGKVAAGEALEPRVLAKLAAAGIDAPMLQRIAAQASGHGQEVNGLKFGMSHQWTDQAAAQAFESAILKDAHAMTLSPGAGDTPLVMSSELGKLLLQFKSFAFAASRHVLLPLAQGVAAGDVRAMTGLLSLVTAGYLSYAAKQKAAGQPIEADNAGRLALEVLDKSNLLGWTGEMIYPAIWQLGFKDFSRWSDRDAVETLLGPSMGTVASSYSRRLPSRLFGDQEEPDQTFSRSDLHFLRRLMPGQNLFYFRRGVNGLEDSVGDLFNLPGMSQGERAEVAQNQ